MKVTASSISAATKLTASHSEDYLLGVLHTCGLPGITTGQTRGCLRFKAEEVTFDERAGLGNKIAEALGDFTYVEDGDRHSKVAREEMYYFSIDWKNGEIWTVGFR